MLSLNISILIKVTAVNKYAYIPAKMTRKKQTENPDDMPVLRRLREAVGLTQAELARRIPDKTRTKTLTQAAISRWENGEDEPELTIPQTRALCRALDLAFEDLPDDFGPPGKSIAQPTRQPPNQMMPIAIPKDDTLM